IHDVAAFLMHMLERIDPARDLHFHTRTTIDTLDYSGTGLNAGSKVAIAAAGPVRRSLWRELPRDLAFPRPFGGARLAFPGAVVLAGVPFASYAAAEREIGILDAALRTKDTSGLPLIVLCDDAAFTAANIANFVWVTFTR